MQITPINRTTFNGILPAYKIPKGIVHPIEKIASDSDIVQISKGIGGRLIGEGRCGRVFESSNSIVKVFKQTDSSGNMKDNWLAEVRNLDTMWELCRKKNDPNYLHKSQKGFFGINLKDDYFIFSSKVEGEHPNPQSAEFNKANLSALMEILERLDRGVDDEILLHPDLRNKNVLVTDDDAGLIDFGSMIKLKFPNSKNSQWLYNANNLTGIQKFAYRMFSSDTDYGVSNLKAFEYDLLAPYLVTANPKQAKALFEMYLPMKSEYCGKRAEFFYDRFEKDKSDISKQVFCEEAIHSELLSKLPDDVREAEIDKLQLNLFIRDLIYITTNNLSVGVNLKEMSEYIMKATEKNNYKMFQAYLNGDKEKGLYYDNCMVHIARCAGYFESILNKFRERIPFLNTTKRMNLIKEKLQ